MKQMDEFTRLSRRELLAVSAGIALSGGLSCPSAAAPAAARPSGIIDVHAHAMLPSWKRRLVAAAAPSPPRYEGFEVPAWTPEGTIEVMDAYGIDAMVLSNPVITEEMAIPDAAALAREMNEELAGIVARFPKRFGAFAALPLRDVSASVVELRHAMDTLGFDGVAIPTSYDGAYPGDPRFEPLLAEMNQRRGTIFAHPRGPGYTKQIALKVSPSMLEFVFDSTRAVVSLVSSGMRAKYPDFNYISAHAGGTVPFLADRIGFGSARTGYDVKLSYDEIIAGLKSFHYDLALTSTRPSLLALREFVPISQIVFGFDFPFGRREWIPAAIDKLMSAGVFDETELIRIARQNPLRLLPGLSARR